VQELTENKKVNQTSKNMSRKQKTLGGQSWGNRLGKSHRARQKGRETWEHGEKGSEQLSLLVRDNPHVQQKDLRLVEKKGEKNSQSK